MPGRITPGTRRMWSVAAASMAPVFPADTAAPARPSPTRRQATATDESGLARTARAPTSLEETTSGACTISMPARPAAPWRSISPASAAPSPTSSTSTPSPAASRAPATGARGASSPPMPSSATTDITGTAGVSPLVVIEASGRRDGAPPSPPASPA
jgi:hypothetical protein